MDLPASVLPWEPRVHQGPSIERLQGDFVANASHELKAPVTSILALAAALRTAINDDPESAQRFTRTLEREAERLAALASDLLDLSRLESGMGHTTTVALDRVVETETDRLRSSAARLGLRLGVEAREALLVSGSVTDLGILIHNLIDNAIRHTPEGGAIVVAVRQVSGWAELTVQDTGIGIAPGEIDHIFDRFYRVDTSGQVSTSGSSPAGGTGLGLALVQKVAEAHGGTVRVRSAPGSGTVFTVRLPLLERAELAVARPNLRRIEPVFEVV